jgi:hypothetical protein
MTPFLLSRRTFLSLAPAAAALAQEPPRQAPTAPPVAFPAHDPDVVREVVAVAHGNFARLKELVEPRPALARANWDWGFGDWESAIDAASHVGNRPIAEFLLAHGARPTIFTMAMLGQLAALKAFLDAVPGALRARGPHGLTLLHHARVGAAAAADVVTYLEARRDADERYPNVPVTDEERAAIVGDYVFGANAAERFRVAANARGELTIQRSGALERGLFHHGGLVFNPIGAEAVKIQFFRTAGRATALNVEDGPLRVEARATAAG